MAHFLKPAAPAPADTTPWYMHPFFFFFWEFCARYSEERFSDEWHLSPEQSLLLHAENTVIPTQVVINSPRAANQAGSRFFSAHHSMT